MSSSGRKNPEILQRKTNFKQTLSCARDRRWKIESWAKTSDFNISGTVYQQTVVSSCTVTSDSNKGWELQYLITLRKSLGQRRLTVQGKEVQLTILFIRFSQKTDAGRQFWLSFFALLSVVYRIYTFYQMSASFKALSCLTSVLIRSASPTLPECCAQLTNRICRLQMRI